MDDYIDYITKDLLAHRSGIKVRKMFGGAGIYLNDVIFGLLINDDLYFKVDDSNRGDYQEFDSGPFVWHNPKAGKDIVMSYWLVPEEVQSNSHLLDEWIDKSVQINSTKD